MEVNASEVAVFTAASEKFNLANIRCSIEESINRFDPVFEAAKQNDIKVRGYVSCIAGTNNIQLNFMAIFISF